MDGNVTEEQLFIASAELLPDGRLNLSVQKGDNRATVFVSDPRDSRSLQSGIDAIISAVTDNLRLRLFMEAHTALGDHT
jgi:hypothetical protein